MKYIVDNTLITFVVRKMWGRANMAAVVLLLGWACIFANGEGELVSEVITIFPTVYPYRQY